MTARLLRFDGRPSGGALLAIAGCIAIAFTAAFVARVSRGAETPSAAPAVPESRLTGEVVSAADRAAAPRLRHAAALPALAPGEVRRPAKKKRSRSVERTASVPVATATPQPESTAEPAATAAPVATSAPPVSPPATTPPARKPSTPASTPGPTFDSSG